MFSFFSVSAPGYENQPIPTGKICQVKNQLDRIFFLFYPASIMAKKLSFQFNTEDEKVLEKLKKNLAPTHGKLTNIAVIRMALRKLAA